MILNAIRRAYRVMEERNWDTIYWAIDLHGVCLKSNYVSGGYEWFNDETVDALRVISAQPENKIILWSSVHDHEKLDILQFFYESGIEVYGFNRNIHEYSTRVSCFEEKFYFSVLLDDKAGFDPDRDWRDIRAFYVARKLSKETA